MVPGFFRASKTRPGIRSTVAVWLAATLAAAAAGEVRAATTDESLRGPDVTIIAEEERTIYEFRQNGQLRMVRVVPELGKPYYLVPRDPTKGFGDLERAEMLLPSWVIVEF
jgi:hypothetical protein